MNREKMEDASVGCQKYPFHNSPYNLAFTEGFKKGAEWLQSQSLSERLTDEEKEKINNLCEEIWSMNGDVAQYGETMINWLIRIEAKFQRIFGTEPFKIK